MQEQVGGVFERHGDIPHRDLVDLPESLSEVPEKKSGKNMSENQDPKGNATPEGADESVGIFHGSNGYHASTEGQS